MQDDDGAPARREQVERAPNRGSCDHRGAVVGPGVKLRGRFFVPLLHGGLPPLVPAHIDQHANQPGLLTVSTEGYRSGRTGSSQEGLLHQVEGVVSAGRQSPRQAVQTLMMGVEHRSDTVGWPVLDGDRQS